MEENQMMDCDTNKEIPNESKGEFTARPYQLELFDIAKQQNSILLLGTGSGKTFISILLIKEMGESIRGCVSESAQRSIFVVNTVPLVYQQAKVIEHHTGFKVGKFEGSMGIDIWTGEKWFEELDKYEVLVIVAQIFSELILCNRLPLEKVNLLIIDECHHATGNHPMREIMRKYATLKIANMNVPRILGLTACVLQKNLKPSDIEKHMKNLEAVLDSSIVTSIDQECVKLYSTKAKERFIICPYNQLPYTFNTLKKELQQLEKNGLARIDSTNTLQQQNSKVKKSVRKLFKGISDVSQTLGDYIILKAIKLQTDYLINLDTELYIEQQLYQYLGNELNKIHAKYINDFNIDDPLTYLSGKVLRLLEILGKRKDAFTLIFVTQRNIAKLLNSLLIELKHKDASLSTLLPEYVVGSSTSNCDLKVSSEEIKKQNDTLDRFRMGLCNTIISTSVLEEGIDVRKCNLVIRFDPPMNFRSYMQSLGRARAENSYFLILCYSKEKNEIESQINCYKCIYDYLLTKSHMRALPSIDQIEQNFREDEIEPPFAPYGLSGPQITFNSAIQLVNRYCGTLPQDRFTDLTVHVDKKLIDNQYYVTLTLPLNSPYRLSVTGKPMHSSEEAKKSAALELCVQLYNRGLLDQYLMPKKAQLQVKESLTNYIPIFDEDIPEGAPKAGTQKRCQIYEKKICQAFRSTCVLDLFLHYLCFQHIDCGSGEFLLDSDCTSTYLGLLTREKLNCSAFPLYSKKWGVVNVYIQPISPISFNLNEMDEIKIYHRFVSEKLLKMNSNLMVFNPQKADHCVFIVPLNKAKHIDFKQIKILNDVCFQNVAHNDKKSHKEYIFDALKYEKYVVSPNYRDLELFFIHNILYDQSPDSPFPDSKNVYKSYRDYVKQRYNLDVTTNQQPLFDCKHFSKEFNYLTQTGPKVADRESKYPKFIPELCSVIPLSIALWAQILCMPSILYRINGLMLEQELYASIRYQDSVKDEYKFYSLLDYHWCENVETIVEGSCEDNLALKFCDKKQMDIYPGMILQAFTPLSAMQNFNLERLEILGDSYLKYSIGKYLFIKEISHHEGMLTLQRSQLVSNKVLYLLAKNKGLPTMYQGSSLALNTAIPYGFIVDKEAEKRMKEENVPPQEWPSYPTRTSTQHFEQAYNPWTQQRVPDKCIADSIEALIGAYLLTGGEKAALHLMSWLGFTFIKEQVSLPTTAIESPDIQVSIVYSMYTKNCLDRLENIIHYKFKEKSFLLQACTHPSYNFNTVTDCYQRLEFLGDAVLDYLITCHIYSSFPTYTPGQLTDLRSHYVKNETLAKIAIKFGLHKFLMHMAPKLNGSISNFMQMLDKDEKEFITEDDTLVAEEVEIPKALGDIVEAVIGAVYIDSGASLKTTWDIIKYLMHEEFNATKKLIPINCVRELYERVPGVEITVHAPQDDSLAKCIVKMKGHPQLTGLGKNRRAAKESAAKLALAYLEKEAQTL